MTKAAVGGVSLLCCVATLLTRTTNRPLFCRRSEQGLRRRLFARLQTYLLSGSRVHNFLLLLLASDFRKSTQNFEPERYSMWSKCLFDLLASIKVWRKAVSEKDGVRASRERLSLCKSQRHRADVALQVLNERRLSQDALGRIHKEKEPFLDHTTVIFPSSLQCVEKLFVCRSSSFE